MLFFTILLSEDLKCVFKKYYILNSLILSNFNYSFELNEHTCISIYEYIPEIDCHFGVLLFYFIKGRFGTGFSWWGGIQKKESSESVVQWYSTNCIYQISLRFKKLRNFNILHNFAPNIGIPDVACLTVKVKQC